jgi:hypothetical protein
VTSRFLAFALLLFAAASRAAPAPPLPSFPPLPAAWFDGNVIVTNKGSYVHVFWNAQVARRELTGPDKRLRLACAARRLAAGSVSAGVDRVKLDVVFVRERDQYGAPRWDTLEKVAHLEFSRRALLAGLEESVAPTKAQMAALFDVFEVR